MQRQTLNVKWHTGFCALLLALALTNPGFAQEKPASPEAMPASVLTVIKVLPGMELEWMNLLKNEVMPALKKGGAKQWGVWRTAVFGEGGTWVISSPIEKMSQFDEPHPLMRGLGEGGLTALMARMQRLVSYTRTFTIGGLPGLEIPSKTGYVPKVAVQAASSVAPGRNEEYEKSAKEMLGVLAKTNVKGVYVGKVGLGGNPNEYHTLVLFDSFADLEKFPPAFAKAADQAKLAPQPAGIETHTEWAVYAYVPELSQEAAATQPTD